MKVLYQPPRCFEHRLASPQAGYSLAAYLDITKAWEFWQSPTAKTPRPKVPNKPQVHS